MPTQRRDGWLVRDQQVLASAEVAGGRAERRRGLIGRDDLDGVLVLSVRWVHTIGVRFPIDVAFCDGDGVVRRTVTMAPGRVGRPCPSARWVVEAPAGSLRSWGVATGDRLELR